MKTETTIQGLNAALIPARTARKTIGFVPTMGNLHQGHLNLVREAKKVCDIVVVSIFVNPIQFGPNEDYEQYPRTLEADSHLLADVGCDVIFAPNVQQMYGEHQRKTSVVVAEMSDILCGQSRSGHFDGVTTVVSKLFHIVQPNIAFFGQKDYQQLQIIRTMVRDLNFPIEIIGVATARAEDGLALSSRNGFLSPKQRQIAPMIYQTLQQSAQSLLAGKALSQVLQDMQQTLQQAGFAVDYVQAYTPELQPITQFDQDVMLFVAAKLGQPRLIDNILVKYPQSVETN